MHRKLNGQQIQALMLVLFKLKLAKDFSFAKAARLSRKLHKARTRKEQNEHAPS
jgi:hypothetical protein